MGPLGFVAVGVGAAAGAWLRWGFAVLWNALNPALPYGTLAANLLGLGLRAGDRVASLMPNRTALLVHYLACVKAGVVAVPLNYRYMPPEIDHALEVSAASLLLAHAEREEDLLGVLAELRGDALHRRGRL